MTSATNKRNKVRIVEVSPNDVVAFIFHVDDKVATILTDFKQPRVETDRHLPPTKPNLSHVSITSSNVFQWILMMMMMRWV